MKPIVFAFIVSVLSSSVKAAECQKQYTYLKKGEESDKVYAGLALKEEKIEYCGPYSGDCPRELGKELNTENVSILCFKDSFCYVGICPN